MCIRDRLETIDRYHVEGRLTNEERQALYMAARKGAEPDLSLIHI